MQLLWSNCILPSSSNRPQRSNQSTYRCSALHSPIPATPWTLLSDHRCWLHMVGAWVDLRLPSFCHDILHNRLLLHLLNRCESCCGSGRVRGGKRILGQVQRSKHLLEHHHRLIGSRMVHVQRSLDHRTVKWRHLCKVRTSTWIACWSTVLNSHTEPRMAPCLSFSSQFSYHSSYPLLCFHHLTNSRCSGLWTFCRYLLFRLHWRWLLSCQSLYTVHSHPFWKNECPFRNQYAPKETWDIDSCHWNFDYHTCWEAAETLDFRYVLAAINLRSLSF